MEMSVHGLSVHGLLQFLTHAHTHTPGKLPTCAVTKTNMMTELQSSRSFCFESEVVLRSHAVFPCLRTESADCVNN